MMLLTLFGLIDLLLGGVLAASPYLGYAGSAAVMALGVIAVIKGIYSVLAGAAAGFYFDLLGWLDLIAGALLLLTAAGLTFGWFLWIGIFMALKGLYSIGVEMVAD